MLNIPISVPGPLEEALLSVLVPAYREGPNIYANLEVLTASLQRMGREFEIIVISDGDGDTHAEASRHATTVALHYDEQRGKGYALRFGIARSRGDIVAFIDADMELHPDGLERLVEQVEGGADVAVGSKRHAESRVSYPAFRRIQSAVYQRMIRLLFRLNVSDTQTGLKAFRGDILRAVAPALLSDGFAFDLELLVELNNRGARIVEGPILLDYAFETTTGVRAVLNVLRDTWGIWRRQTHNRKARGVHRLDDLSTTAALHRPRSTDDARESPLSA